MVISFNFTKAELQRPIHELGLSVRATNSLICAGMETLGDLIDFLKTDDLKQFRNIGDVTVQEIMNKIAVMQTQQYRDKTAALEEEKKEAARIETQIATYKAAIKELEQQELLCHARIGILKNEQKKRGAK